MGRKIPAANGLRRNPAIDSDAKSILSSRSNRSGGSGGSKDSRYHLNTGQPVVSVGRKKSPTRLTLDLGFSPFFCPFGIFTRKIRFFCLSQCAT